MKTATQKKIKEHFKGLPPIIKDAINGLSWEERIHKIVDDHGLLIDQGAVIEKEVFLLILGLSDPKEFVSKIKKETGLRNDEVVRIAEEIDEYILKEIKNKIIEESEKKEGIEQDPINELLPYRKEIENELPSIDLTPPKDVDDRDQLINELGNDITIDDSPDDGSRDMLSIEEQMETQPDHHQQEEGEIKPYEPRSGLDPNFALRVDNKSDRTEAEEGEFAQPVEKEREQDTLNPNNFKDFKPRESLDPDLELRADPRSNKIEISGEELKNKNTIEFEDKKESGPLPDLDPLRTLERDTDDLRGRPHRKTEVVDSLKKGEEPPVEKPTEEVVDNKEDVGTPENIDEFAPEKQEPQEEKVGPEPQEEQPQPISQFETHPRTAEPIKEDTTIPNVPENLPTESPMIPENQEQLEQEVRVKQEQEERHQTPPTPQGGDPYREPIE